MERNRPQTFDEALQVVNEAMQVQGAGLKDLISADYANFRTAFSDLAPRVSREVQAKTGPYVDTARAYTKPAVDAFDVQFKKNPYLILGGVALGAIILGYLFGRTKTPPADYTGLTYGDVQPTDNAELA